MLCFDAGGYCDGRYIKRVMRTGPDRFSNAEGLAPPGCIALSVSPNHGGSSLEYHHVPARFLSPASPTSSKDYVLVLRGDLQGQFCKVVRWIRKEKKAEVRASIQSQQSIVLPADDVCLAIAI
jgi:hypothetical protein